MLEPPLLEIRRSSNMLSWIHVLLPLLAAIPSSFFSLMMLTFSVDSAEGDSTTELFFDLSFVVVPASIILAFAFRWTKKAKTALFCAYLPVWWPILVLIIRLFCMGQTEDSAAVPAEEKGGPPGKVYPAFPRRLSELRQQVVP